MKEDSAKYIFGKLHAIRLYDQKRYEEALRVFPEHATFLDENKSRPYEEVRKELEDELQKIAKQNG